MTNEATNTDHSAVGHSCAHCDSSEDHHALDVKGIVDDFRSSLNAAMVVRVLLALTLVASGLMWASLGVLAGVVAWALATAGGILTVSATRGKYGAGNSVILGTVASAAIMPVGAWAVSAVLGGTLIVALAAASGWFLAGAVVETLRDRSLAGLLIEDSRDGEAAREGVMFGNPTSPWVGLGWAVFTAALFGAWAWVVGAFPFALLPLIPLQVALALLSRKGNRKQ